MKIAIVGAGKLGLRITEALLGGDCDITLIDKEELKLEKLSSYLDVMTIAGDAKNTKVLKQIKIENFDFLLATTSSDETNMVIAAFAKKLGCKNVIARVRVPEHIDQYNLIKETFGIDYIVNPDLALTIEIYKHLVEKYSLSNGIFSTGKISLIECNLNKLPKLKDLSISNVRDLLPGMLIVAVSRNGKIIIPHGATVLEKSDLIYVVGEKEPIAALNKKVHERGKYTNLQKVMIVGGGNTGFFLAQKLSDFGTSVKLIELNKERCHYLSTHLENVMILNANGTDVDMLEEENISEMDAFITTTGFDEENLLLALSAKQLGVPDVISKISRDIYASLIEKIGIDMVLNPLDIVCSNVLRHIQGSKQVISSQLIQGQAEIMEILATPNMELTNVMLNDLTLPDGVLIVAIHRGSSVIIPTGADKIMPGDRVMILSLLSALDKLESLLKTR